MEDSPLNRFFFKGKQERSWQYPPSHMARNSALAQRRSAKKRKWVQIGFGAGSRLLFALYIQTFSPVLTHWMSPVLFSTFIPETPKCHWVTMAWFFGTRKWKILCHDTKNKNTLETCKNPRPSSSWSELTKSCTTSTMNFHIAYFSWIPQNNTRLKLSCKFGESKCNPC